MTTRKSSELWIITLLLEVASKEKLKLYLCSNTIKRQCNLEARNKNLSRKRIRWNFKDIIFC